MKRVLSGELVRVGEEPAVRDKRGKTRLVYNLFDGLTGKRIRITVETLPEP